MIEHRSMSMAGGLLLVVSAGLLMAAPVAAAQDKEKLDLDKIPARVMDGLNARFPKAEIQKWTREKEGEIVVYDIEFKQNNRKYEADVKEDGTIHNWERAIEAKDLPAAVRKSAEKKYPGSTMKEIMSITTVVDGKEEMEGYEIVLGTVDRKDVEITVAPDGKILEEPESRK
jgi:Putative beta-lactamase-inhibitor-like, PepSY-like